MPEDCLLEMRLKYRRTLTLLVDEVDTGLGSIIECQDYSSVIHLFTITAYVMRFVRVLKQAVNRSNSHVESLSIKPQELARAEAEWIQESQRLLVSDKHFPV